MIFLLGIWNLGFGTWFLTLGIWNLVFGAWFLLADAKISFR